MKRTAASSSGARKRGSSGEEDSLPIASSFGPVRSVEGWVVFVTGLHEEVREDDIEETFGEYGRVKQIKMNFDRRTGNGKGYALVEYDKQSEAQDAINTLHGTQLMGTPIGVHWAFVKPTARTGVD